MGFVRKKTIETIYTYEREIAAETVQRHYALVPELEQRYGAAGREKCLQDAQYHVSYLAEAIQASSQLLFKDYVMWAKQMLEARQIPATDLAVNLNCLKEALAMRLPSKLFMVAAKYLNAALVLLESDIQAQACFLETGAPLQELASQYMNLLLKGNRQGASRLILDAVEKGAPVRDVYLHVFQPVQYEIGRMWQNAEISVAQEHYCTAATQLIMSQLYMYVFQHEQNGNKAVATCIAGDLHEIGVRMVADFLEMDGWDTIYLGANTPVASIIQTLKDQQASLLLVSATMTYHVRSVSELIERVRNDEAVKHVKIMVGGYPFNKAPELWKAVGADGFATSAREVPAIAEKLVKAVA